MFQKCFEIDSKVFVSVSVLKLFVRIEVIAATRELGGLVYQRVHKQFQEQKMKLHKQEIRLFYKESFLYFVIL